MKLVQISGNNVHVVGMASHLRAQLLRDALT